VEIAAHLSVIPDAIHKWIKRKQLSAHKVGGCGITWLVRWMSSFGPEKRRIEKPKRDGAAENL
jgi:hypothetical protein